MRIIYKQPNGFAAIICPADKAFTHEINPSTGKNWTIEEIAAKDVPTGLKYKIVEDSEIPTDRSFRNAWTVDESDLTDGVGA